ncbi:aminopeptidase P family protein [Necropsobacter massiliensis]|uniref:aminopeptidase P family protein n=1 Tax=Necropsobacter massiliensis TaxID=1400001 RepID=UPI0005958806|nr:aminopeptidase P family protein [Necropsobacter massiliensis]
MTAQHSPLARLRQAMQQHQLDGWIAPSADPHLSEYLPEHWQTRRWLSGFTGSVGTLAVTATQASLWVDSRYWEQAAEQLNGSGISLGKLGTGQTHIDWLINNLPTGATVGAAADGLSLSAQRQLERAFAAKSIQLCSASDIVADIWSQRPPLPAAPIYPHAGEFVVQSATQKLAKIRRAMQEKGANAHLISSLDDIAWLTNLRGSDVPYNPVFLAHLLIENDSATVFVEPSKLNAQCSALLDEAGIRVADYHAVTDRMAALQGGLLLDPNKVAISTLAKLPAQVTLIEAINPSTYLKAMKSAQEIAFIRQAMVEDGVALAGFFAELEQLIAENKAFTELDISEMLIKHRSHRPHYISPSFNTIAGFNANAALPHYSATAEHFSRIEGNGVLLIDSGAQYHTGTTDITRVIAIRNASDAQKRDFTYVLKAHIALAQAIFPEGILSPMLDAICRQPLWQAQREYGHGTGHGIGYVLNVHEGPQVISYHAAPQPQHAMRAGMLTSNEPGLYRPQRWGIRIENLVVNQPVEQPQEHEFGTFLCFETVTLCPIDTRLIDKSLLNQNEIDWLNNYHRTVRDKLAPHCEGRAKEWLLDNTAAI